MWQLNPKLDIVFKMLFADERNRASLVALLSDVLRPSMPITSVTVLNTETQRHSLLDKGAILDLRVRLGNGSQIHVEMQHTAQASFRERGLYYWARVHGTQLDRGQSYSALRPTIGIFILDYPELEGAHFHSVFQLLDRRSHRLFTDAIELHVIELPKLQNLPADEYTDPVLKWARFFAAESESEQEQLTMTYPELRETKETLDRLRLDRVAQELAELREHELATYKETVELARAEAEAKGRAEGEARGRAEGEAKGRAEGEATLRKTIEALCVASEIMLNQQRRSWLNTASLEELRKLLQTLAVKRVWPLGE